MTTPFISYVELANQLCSWGYNNPTADIEKVLADAKDNRTQTIMLVGIMAQLKAQTELLRCIKSGIATLPQKTAKAERAAEIALEKERQKTAKQLEKTAKAQAKAVNSSPPNISVVHMTPEEIERAISNGRVLRKF